MWFFKKKRREEFEYIGSPVDGEVKPLSSLTDGYFSKLLLGNGLIVTPVESDVIKFYAPASGTLEVLQHTNNVFGIRTKSGIPVLLHIGDRAQLETSKEFIVHVKPGDPILRGDLLAEIKLSKAKQHKINLDAIVVITNGMKITKPSEGNISAGDRLFLV